MRGLRLALALTSLDQAAGENEHGDRQKNAQCENCGRAKQSFLLGTTELQVPHQSAALSPQISTTVLGSSPELSSGQLAFDEEDGDDEGGDAASSGGFTWEES